MGQTSLKHFVNSLAYLYGFMGFFLKNVIWRLILFRIDDCSMNIADLRLGKPLNTLSVKALFVLVLSLHPPS